MFVIIFLLSLFGITLVGFCGYYFGHLLHEYFRGEHFAVIEQKARSAIEAADLGWVAILSAPLLGLFLGSFVIPVELWLKGARAADPVELWFKGVQEAAPLVYGRRLLVVIAVSTVAGVIVAASFWTTSAILGKAREWSTKPGCSSDPDFDGPA
jgi:hypothetical protein